MRNLWVWLCVAMTALALAGCGHTDEEMAAKQREIDKLAADLKAAKAVMADDQAKFAESQNALDRMREQLKTAGLGLEKSKDESLCIDGGLKFICTAGYICRPSCLYRSHTELVPSILKATETNGKLYILPSGFSIVSLAGSSKTLGSDMGWTASTGSRS